MEGSILRLDMPWHMFVYSHTKIIFSQCSKASNIVEINYIITKSSFLFRNVYVLCIHIVYFIHLNKFYSGESHSIVHTHKLAVATKSFAFIFEDFNLLLNKSFKIIVWASRQYFVPWFSFDAVVD